MRKYFLFLSIILSIVSVNFVYAEVLNNSGFIPGQIWYSKEALVEGETINIHTAVWNSEKETLSAKVEFYDKNVILGSRDIVLSSSELKDVYIPWKITSGDHLISAKIISSQATVSGKKEKVILSRNTTSNDKQFVSVVTKNSQGESVSNTDVISNQISKTSSDLVGILPDNIETTVTSGIGVIDDFRDKTSSNIDQIKYNTKKEINLIDAKIKEKTVAQTLDEKSNLEDATKKPIAYIKLFLFTTLSFIFGSKIIFYGLLLLVLFYIFRWIYRKIKYR
jgi:hypothetical protein